MPFNNSRNNSLSTSIATSEQEQIARKLEIENIFHHLLQNNSKVMQRIRNSGRSVQLFKKQLEFYKNALIKEVSYLDIKYNHPLRAAQALKDYNDNGNLDNFIYEATNPDFNPDVRAIAWGIAGFVMTAVVITALTMIVCAALSCPITELALITFVTLEFSSAAVCLGVGGLTASLKEEEYEPITASMEQCRGVAGFFKLRSESDYSMSDHQEQQKNLA